VAEFDYVVVGGGSGGIASARRAAEYGAKVAVIDGMPFGGTCVRLGCIPKKLFANAAELTWEHKFGPGYGVAMAKPEVNLSVLSQRVAKYLQKLTGIYANNLAGSKVEALHGWAEVQGDGRTVRVAPTDGSPERMLRGKHVLIATGGRPTLPPIPGAAEHGLVSDDVFQLQSVPKSLVVIGSGYIGVEMAGIFNRLGSDVTLLTRSGNILQRFDECIQRDLLASMEAHGIKVLRNTPPESVERCSEGYRVNFPGGQVVAEQVLFATGRAPNTPAGLESAGVKTDSQGHVLVDGQQSTNVEGVFAVGDVTRAPALTPVAIAAGRLLSDRLFGGKPDAQLDYSVIPTVVFSHPPVGTVGLTEQEARDRLGGDKVKVYNAKFTSLFYALAEPADKDTTTMKLVCELPRGAATPPGDEIVRGVHIVGKGAEEMLQGFAVAVRMGATKRDFDSSVAIHPTSAEELVTMKPWSPHHARA
jgi:glutathione reductase (NADPH)